MTGDKTTLELRSSSTVERAAAPPRLNPVFCRERGVVLIEWDGAVARVGMVDPGDLETLAALRFAIGCEIAPIAMTRAEVDQRNGTDRSALRGASGVPAPTSLAARELRSLNRPGLSLSTIAGEHVIAKVRFATPLAAFEPLLKAGLTVREAGAVLLAAHAGGQQFAPETLALAEIARDQGGFSGETECGAAQIPAWIASALSSLPADADPGPLLADMLGAERALATRRTHLIRLAVEIAVAGVLVVVIWWPLSMLMSLVAALGACVSLYWLVGSEPRFALVRIAILELVSALKRNGVPSAAAISIALERLRDDAPTWGRVPDTREELARALRLDPLTTATLNHGALEIASRCASEICAGHGDDSLATGRWIVRLVAASAFCLALLIHLA